MIDVPTLLRKARKQAGLTQAELAERAGTSQPAVARYEAGTSSPAITTLDRLLHACGFTADLRIQRSAPADLSGANARLLKSRRKEVIDILAGRGFHSPRVFGSTARGTAGTDSDIDLLVTPSGRLELMDLLGAQGELEALLGTSVDLATEELLKPEVLKQAVKEAVPV